MTKRSCLTSQLLSHQKQLTLYSQTLWGSPDRPHRTARGQFVFGAATLSASRNWRIAWWKCVHKDLFEAAWRRPFRWRKVCNGFDVDKSITSAKTRKHGFRCIAKSSISPTSSLETIWEGGGKCKTQVWSFQRACVKRSKDHRKFTTFQNRKGTDLHLGPASEATFRKSS